MSTSGQTIGTVDLLEVLGGCEPQEDLSSLRRERFTELQHKDLANAEALGLAEQALDDLDSGRFDDETVERVCENAGRFIVQAYSYYSAHRALLQLLDFIRDPCRETAQALREPIVERARTTEDNMIRDSIKNPVELTQRWLGLGIDELARFCGVKPETVRRWKRTGSSGRYSRILDLAKMARWLEKAGLTEKEAREWFRAPHPELDGRAPDQVFERPDFSRYDVVYVCELARDVYRKLRNRKW